MENQNNFFSFNNPPLFFHIFRFRLTPHDLFGSFKRFANPLHLGNNGGKNGAKTKRKLFMWVGDVEMAMDKGIFLSEYQQKGTARGKNQVPATLPFHGKSRDIFKNPPRSE